MSPSLFAVGPPQRKINYAATIMLRFTRPASYCLLSHVRHCVEGLGLPAIDPVLSMRCYHVYDIGTVTCSTAVAKEMKTSTDGDASLTKIAE
jgi:hypothetical protein